MPRPNLLTISVAFNLLLVGFFLMNKSVPKKLIDEKNDEPITEVFAHDINPFPEEKVEDVINNLFYSAYFGQIEAKKKLIDNFHKDENMVNELISFINSKPLLFEDKFTMFDTVDILSKVDQAVLKEKSQLVYKYINKIKTKNYAGPRMLENISKVKHKIKQNIS